MKNDLSRAEWIKRQLRGAPKLRPEQVAALVPLLPSAPQPGDDPAPSGNADREWTNLISPRFGCDMLDS
jgi:hypothetical protein